MQPFERLEHEWAKFNDLDPAGMVACSSGTAALHLALEALQLPPGSEVIVPDFTMVACPRAVAMAGLRPVFVDCNDRLVIDEVLFERQKNSTPHVVMPVHVYGRHIHEDLFFYADQYNWFIVEDLAEAHGVRPNPVTDAACWSFYKNKIVAGEEGGAVWFRDPSHAKLARQLRSLGFTDAHDYNHVPRGHNYRMSNVHASCILGDTWDRGNASSLFVYKTGETPEKRREIESWYGEACPTEWRQPARDAVWVYDFRVPGMTSEMQDRTVRTLRDNKIEARHGFKPMSQQEEFLKCRFVFDKSPVGKCVPNSWVASREVIYLPVQPGVTTRADAERAFDIVRSVVPRT